MLNHKVETGQLISEIIKANKDQKYIEEFIRYLVDKIVNEGYFKSSLFRQLIRLAEHDFTSPVFFEDGEEQNLYDDTRPEGSNQQLILKLIIKS